MYRVPPEREPNHLRAVGRQPALSGEYQLLRVPQGRGGDPDIFEHYEENISVIVSPRDCAKCHEKIDPLGFALEQYDAIGRLRSEKSNTITKLPNGQTIQGLDGLRDYLVHDRRDDVLRQFCRKLLGYALGRQVQLSDEPLLDDMQKNLARKDYRFSVAIEEIVKSRQFRDIRGRKIEEQ